MAHTYTRIYLHIVFATRSRAPFFTKHSDSTKRTSAYISGIIRRLDSNPIAVNCHRDHIHILCEIPAKISIQDFVAKIKASSSKWFKRTYGDREFYWQEGYGCFSVNRDGLDRVRQYIENQAEHHRARSFSEEYERFIKEYGYDWEAEEALE